MNFSFIHPFKLNLRPAPAGQHPQEHALPSEDNPGTDALVPLHITELNTSEGGEFLDDALRMEDMVPRTPSADDVKSDLRKKGYGEDFEFEENPFGLYNGDLDMRLNPEQFHVDEIDRVEDPSGEHA